MVIYHRSSATADWELAIGCESASSWGGGGGGGGGGGLSPFQNYSGWSVGGHYYEAILIIKGLQDNINMVSLVTKAVN